MFTVEIGGWGSRRTSAPRNSKEFCIKRESARSQKFHHPRFSISDIPGLWRKHRQGCVEPRNEKDKEASVLELPLAPELPAQILGKAPINNPPNKRCTEHSPVENLCLSHGYLCPAAAMRHQVSTFTLHNTPKLGCTGISKTWVYGYLQNLGVRVCPKPIEQ
jgi:hypothetical protein